MRIAKICKEIPNKKPDPFGRDRASVYGVAVTYFRVRMHTIIGADPFHGSVRDGKTWFQIAIAATWKVEETRPVGLGPIREEIAPSAKNQNLRAFDAHGYRVKPHGQLVLVS